ncbi:MAG: carbohydrate porin, partial [Maioricimonas sp. JB049]
MNPSLIVTNLCVAACLGGALMQTASALAGETAAGDAIWNRPVASCVDVDDLISVGHWTCHQDGGCDTCDVGCDARCDGSSQAHSAPDDLWNRSHLGGDWGGLRSAMAGHGIIADVSLTQFYQGIVHGGRERDFEYGGKLDYIFMLQGKQLGLNEGFMATIHAETRYGHDIILDGAALAPANAAMLYPEFDDTTAITGLQILQAFSEEWAVTFGKFNAFDFINMLYPQTGRGVDGFMNVSAFLPMTVIRTVPLSFLGAGVVKLNDKRIQGSLMVYDNNNIPTTSGFDDLFDNGASILGMYRIFTELGGKPGSHAVMATWSNGTYTSLDRTGWTFIPTVGIVPAQDTGTWAAVYILEQQLWADSTNAKRNVGLISQWGLADPRTTPFDWSANIALQAQGLIESRPNDTTGLAWFYSGLSDDLKNLTSPLLPLQDVHGLEIYYNAA